MKETVFYYDGNTLEDKISNLKSKLKTCDLYEKVFIENDIKKYEFGLKGEKKIISYLKKSHIPMYILHDLDISYKNYNAHIDFVIFTSRNCYILECKSIFGNILIDENNDFYRIYNRKRVLINSPYIELKRHEGIIKEFIYDELGLAGKFFSKVGFNNYYRELVVLTNELTQIKCLSSDLKDKVIRLDKLINFIKKEEKRTKNLPDSESKIKELCDKIINLVNDNVNDEINITELNIDENVFNLNVILKNKLEKYRYNKSKSLGYKPYFIFNDKTLNELVTKKPENENELKNIKGFSRIKIKKYGKDIIKIINN